MATLGEYLKSSRERLKPADVGLPTFGGSRRRTPGLRREEVATLAGVSVDYLIRLEQGRDTNPSPSVVSALATALQLSESQRLELWALASVPHTGEFCPSQPLPTTEVTPTVRAILDGLDPVPAFVVGARLDVLAWNPPWHALASDLGYFGAGVPNVARHAFTQRHPGWDDVADDAVARLRQSSERCDAGDPALAALVEELSVSNEFRRRWSRAPVAAASRGGDVRVGHPELGELRFSFEALAIGDADQHLITWHAADAETRTAFATAARQELSPPLRLAR